MTQFTTRKRGRLTLPCRMLKCLLRNHLSNLIAFAKKEPLKPVKQFSNHEKCVKATTVLRIELGYPFFCNPFAFKVKIA